MRRARRWSSLAILLTGLLSGAEAAAQRPVLDRRTHLLRMGSRPEWSETSAQPHGRTLDVRFRVEAPTGERTLVLDQAGVKQRWRVVLNGRALGVLHQDENAMTTYWPIPPDGLVEGENTLRIEPVDTLPDDIRVGGLALLDGPVQRVLSEASLQVEVVSAADGAPLPARVTVVNERGALQEARAEQGERLAVRPGMAYTGTGRASLGVPAGRYRVYASRGFEYGVDSVDVVLRPGERARRTLRLAREVPTEGWVAADTHVHTVTHSGHGDATVHERAVTVAGEGIELPVLTDHNVHAELGPAAEEMGVRHHFTPVVGNEVTTRVGHFNIFPVSAQTPPPSPRVEHWRAAAQEIHAVPGVTGIVLNHARDVHSGFRPFGPERHLALAGMRLDGWTLPANAMEVVNSGAQLAEPMLLLRDWLGMLNGGHLLTPVGASDSHDVARYLVGQARTYIRADDRHPGRIDVGRAMERFRAGAVMVSFGLLAELRVDGRHGPGDVAPVRDTVTVAVRVLGPAWTRAERVSLYANGRRIRTATVARGAAAGVKWSGTWRLPRPAHDVHLVAIAEGPDPQRQFWPIAKPYQTTSLYASPRVLGASGAVWLDADGDGRPTPARDYAARLVDAAGDRLPELMTRLAAYDQAVAVQAAALLAGRGVAPTHPDLLAALRGAAPATRSGFRDFAKEWTASRNALAGAAP